MKALSIGEVLWDVFPAQEFLGGAPLNVCANLHRCGDEALLLSAVGNDPRGHAALASMQALGLSTRLIQTIPSRATGTATVGKDAAGDNHFTIERPAAFDAIAPVPLTDFTPDWLYFGTLLQTQPEMEQLVEDLIAAHPSARCFYDMNLREGHWDLPLVERLCYTASILKINDVEAETLSNLTGLTSGEFSLDTFCPAWSQRFGIDLLCVTLGPHGCCIHAEGKTERFPGHKIQVADTVGAGDAFAAAFLHGFAAGWSLDRCAGFANALGALVASRPGATPAWTLDEVRHLYPSI